MTTPAPTHAEYLERLRDLLPARDAQRILEDVDGLIHDRVDAELQRGAASEEDAFVRALKALGSPEQLAAQLTDAPLSISFATRLTFVRSLAILFSAHLVLSIVLTAAGGGGTAIPGLLGPLPLDPLAAVFTSVVSIFLLDTGLIFLLFALLGRGQAPAGLPALQLVSPASRRDAALALVLLALIALILHPFRDQVFAVRDGDTLVGFLAPDLVAVLPFVDLALVLFAVRQILILWKGRDGKFALLVDAGASLVLAFALVYGATRPEQVRFPESALGASGAETLENLVTRVLLLVFVASALFLTVRAVKRLLRLRQLIG